MFVLIQFEKRSFCFDSPVEIISCHDPRELKEVFCRAEGFLKHGYYLAGFLSYEAGYSFEENIFPQKKKEFPLFCMGCYRSPGADPFLRQKWSAVEVSSVVDNISYDQYSEDIERIRQHIREGDVYQITYCLKKKFVFQGSSLGLYHALLRAQPVPYPAYIETKDHRILSLSPELLIRKNKDFIVTKPMKGTWPRGIANGNNLWGSLRLKYDKKNRAENIMIADLLRNDLGRIGFHVRAPRLFDVATYRTLYQMTSTVTARVSREMSFYDIFKAIFPSGSVTGAPKIKAMEIIKALEPEDRKIYTGAIGYVTPDKDFFFNVPIRTLLIENGAGEMGVGGGIVWDSTSQGEWQEGLLKAKFLMDFARKEGDKAF